MNLLLVLDCFDIAQEQDMSFLRNQSCLMFVYAIEQRYSSRCSEERRSERIRFFLFVSSLSSRRDRLGWVMYPFPLK